MKTNKTDIAAAMGVDLGPCLYLEGDAVEALGSLELGKKVSFTVEGEIESISKDSYHDGEKHASVRISKIDGKDIKPEQEEYDEED